MALRRFLSEHGGDYEIAAELCDLFGHNTTTASDGILRRKP
jgi:cephalosporin hydroxylase